MAINFMNMPAAQYPRSALLDFAPLAQSLTNYNAGSDQAQQQRNMTQIGQTAASQGYGAAGKQAMGLGEVDAGMELNKQGEGQQDRLNKRYGSLAQRIDQEQDPNQRSRMWTGFLGRLKRESAAMGINGEFDPDEMDPMTGPKLFMAQAGVGTTNKDAPSSVQEWEYYQKLAPEQKEQFSALKRQNNILVGDQIINRTTGAPVANVGNAITQGEIAKGEGQNVAKVRSDMPEAKLRLEMVTGGLDRLEQTAKSLATMPGLDAVAGGLYAAYAPNVSTAALDAQTELENLKVKISGVVLQSMRDMSKTGGAVGQVTEREWPRLENMIANLDPRQSKERFLANLQQVVEYAQGVKAQLQAAYEADLQVARGGASIPEQTQQAPQQNRPDPLGLFGGN